MLLVPRLLLGSWTRWSQCHRCVGRCVLFGWFTRWLPAPVSLSVCASVAVVCFLVFYATIRDTLNYKCWTQIKSGILVRNKEAHNCDRCRHRQTDWSRQPAGKPTNQYTPTDPHTDGTDSNSKHQTRNLRKQHKMVI